MAQGAREIRERLSKEHRVEIDHLNNLDALAKEAYDKPWWRNFIKTVESRRLQFLNDLVTMQQEQRAEDMMRGRIQELTFILTVDANMKRIFEDKETGDGGSSRAS